MPHEVAGLGPHGKAMFEWLSRKGKYAFDHVIVELAW